MCQNRKTKLCRKYFSCFPKKGKIVSTPVHWPPHSAPSAVSPRNRPRLSFCSSWWTFHDSSAEKKRVIPEFDKRRICEEVTLSRATGAPIILWALRGPKCPVLSSIAKYCQVPPSIVEYCKELSSNAKHYPTFLGTTPQCRQVLPGSINYCPLWSNLHSTAQYYPPVSTSSGALMCSGLSCLAVQLQLSCVTSLWQFFSKSWNRQLDLLLKIIIMLKMVRSV